MDLCFFPLGPRYDGWPWFREHVDLIAMILAKSDLGINANYDAQLVDGAPGGDGDGSGELGRDVRRRLAAARRAVLRVTRADDLSSGFLMLARSMKVRNPLVDPLNVMQAELLKRLRKLEQDEADGHEKAAPPKMAKQRMMSLAEEEGEEERQVLEDALLITINGISQGMKNSG